MTKRIKKRKKKKRKRNLLKPDKDNKHYNEDAAELLPCPVSSISTQKKNTSRFSVYVEDEFLIGVSDHTLTYFNLNKGVEMTPLLFEQIIQKETEWAVREYLVRLLGRRDHARVELKRKAQKKGYSSDIIENILDELEKKGYINNASFARKFAHDKFEFNKWGSFRIRAELKQKGISDSDITLALNEIDEEDLEQAVIDLVKKNIKKFQRTEERKRKKKVFDFLLRKGYDTDIIIRQMPTILELINK